MFTLAQISDIHLAPLPPFPARALLGKRLTGFVMWRLRRARVHRPEVLAALLEDLRQQTFDHLCVSGDVVNLSLPAEIARATGWLQGLEPTDRVSLVPGNHDAYTEDGRRLALEDWTPWTGGEFPSLRRFGAVALIGLNSAVVTPPFFASGRLGEAQLRTLETMLASLGAEGMTRIVVLHHPPQDGAAPTHKALTDAPAFRAVIARAGAELILHGHLHRPVRATIDGPRGPVPVYGAGSASLLDPRHGLAAHYHLIDVDGGEISIRSRLYDPADRVFRETFAA